MLTTVPQIVATQATSHKVPINMFWVVSTILPCKYQFCCLLPTSELEILLIPIESEEVHPRCKMQCKLGENAIHEEETAAEETNDTTTVYSNV